MFEPPGRNIDHVVRDRHVDHEDEDRRIGCNTTHAHGSATDQDGNSYVFNYSNSFRISNTLADPAAFSGLMTDSFTLAGQGPAKLNNGFVAVFTTDFVSVGFEPLISWGDPISFAPYPQGYTPHCDPL